MQSSTSKTGSERPLGRETAEAVGTAVGTREGRVANVGVADALISPRVGVGTGVVVDATDAGSDVGSAAGVGLVTQADSSSAARANSKTVLYKTFLLGKAAALPDGTFHIDYIVRRTRGQIQRKWWLGDLVNR